MQRCSCPLWHADGSGCAQLQATNCLLAAQQLLNSSMPASCTDAASSLGDWHYLAIMAEAMPSLLPRCSTGTSFWNLVLCTSSSAQVHTPPSGRSQQASAAPAASTASLTCWHTSVASPARSAHQAYIKLIHNVSCTSPGPTASCSPALITPTVWAQPWHPALHLQAESPLHQQPRCQVS